MVFFFQAEDGIRVLYVTGVQTCALPISPEVTSGFTVRLQGLGDAQRAWVDEIFPLDRQRGRGALFLPEKARLCGGWANRSEERRVGKGCRERWGACSSTKRARRGARRR